MFSDILTWIYFIIIFVIASISLIVSFIKHRNEWQKSAQYITIALILASGIIAITLIAIGYPFSDRVYAYNSIQSRESMQVVIYGLIILIIGLIGYIILVVKGAKKGKLAK